MDAPTGPAVFDPPEHLFYNDKLADPSCACTPDCRSATRTFREIASRARAAGTRFFPCTPSEFLVIPHELVKIGLYGVATFDLDGYADFAAVLETARTLTAKRGRVNREIARAEKQGYFAKFFSAADYAADIVAIHASKTVRDGRPMEGSHYQRSAEDIASADRRRDACAHHNHRHWGVFVRDAATNRDVLVGYVATAQIGACAWYNAIMGHGDHLRHGIMYLLHYHLVAELMRNRPPGLRYLTYFTFLRRPDDPASHWKYLALFKPVYFHYLEDRPLVMPAEPPMPGFAEALLTVKETVSLPWPDAVSRAAAQGISQEWLVFLHRLWVVQQARAPGLFNAVLRAGPAPSPDILRPLMVQTFPLEALEGIVTAGVILHARGRGLDCLLPLKDREIIATIVHGNAAELAVLRAMYPKEWSYEADTTQSPHKPIELLILEASAGGVGSFPAAWIGAKPRVLVAASGRLEPETLARQIAGLAHGAYLYQGRTFRHGHPDEQFWYWFEPARTAAGEAA